MGSPRFSMDSLRMRAGSLARSMIVSLMGGELIQGFGLHSTLGTRSFAHRYLACTRKIMTATGGHAEQRSQRRPIREARTAAHVRQYAMRCLEPCVAMPTSRHGYPQRIANLEFVSGPEADPAQRGFALICP